MTRLNLGFVATVVPLPNPMVCPCRVHDMYSAYRYSVYRIICLPRHVPQSAHNTRLRLHGHVSAPPGEPNTVTVLVSLVFNLLSRFPHSFCTEFRTSYSTLHLPRPTKATPPRGAACASQKSGPGRRGSAAPLPALHELHFGPRSVWCWRYCNLWTQVCVFIRLLVLPFLLLFRC